MRYTRFKKICALIMATSKKALIYGHLGIGDIINCIGMIRYFATIYDRVTVVCLEKYSEKVNRFFDDDPKIDLLSICDEKYLNPLHGGCSDTFIKHVDGYDLKFCGISALILNNDEKYIIENLPFCFYRDVEIDHSIFWTYFKIPHTANSISLYNIIKDSPYKDNYIITHSNSSTGKVFDISSVESILHINRNETLIIDLNENIYEESHSLFEFANQFINKPIIDLYDLLCNASSLVLADSSIFCMAIHLPIKTEKCYYFSRDSSDYSYLYLTTDIPETIRKFTSLLDVKNVIKYY
jgi:hypothetical protein